MFLFLTIAYAITSFFLFLYSYTQVDLSLTLSQISIWQTIQKFFQHIGYFQRPLSTTLFLFILFALFTLYFVVIYAVKKDRITKKQVWRLVTMISIVLVFSYPAFSYDMFNYMFTAKTVLLYHKNPYIVIPLQFSGFEPWLSFMHWTHLPSAYTPFWIALTLPAYFLGFGFFLLIMWNIKILVAVFYISCVYFLEKLLDHQNKKDILLGMAIFAFNPLVLIETLVSGHNDIVMMSIGLFAILLLVQKKKWSSFAVLAFSIAAKLITIFLLPIYFFRWNKKLALGLMLVGFLLVITQREVLGWYWIWILPFVALFPESTELILLSAGVSLGLLLRYAPFLYLGNWNSPAPLIKEILTYGSIAISLVVIGFTRWSRRHLL